MSVATGSGLAKYFGAQDVFTGVSFALAKGEKAGLIGPNGVGKTTLLRIIAGLEAPTQGNVYMASDLSVGYLPQDARIEGTSTLWEAALTALAPLRRLEQELRRLERAIADSDDEAVWRRYEECEHRFQAAGGYDYDWRARQTLEGLGLTESLQTPVNQLSGGQHTRARLAQLLLQRPDLLLLDEPTNHLDLQALTWLESFLKGWGGSLIAISHDRYFLDAVANVIWELGPSSLDRYRGNYSAFEIQKAERLEQQRREYEKQQEFIRTTEAFIRRYKAGQRYREARGRQKRLNRMERLELHHQRRPPSMRLRSSFRGGSVLLEAHDAAIGFDPAQPLFTTDDLILIRPSRAALIGPNGSGKTTFLRTVLGEMPALSGSLMLGKSVLIGYLSQAQQDLHPGRTLMEEIQSVREMTPAETRKHLALFLFTGEEPFKRVGDLSGGERSRVALAKLTLLGANLLVLDEPTNQLDMLARDALEAVLADYDGTILFVSHDRYFIDSLATEVWAIEDGHLRTYPGNYSDYVAARADAEAEPDPVGAKATEPEPRGQRGSRSSPEARAAQREERRRRERQQEMEERIAALEARLAEVESSLAEAARGEDVEALRDLGREHQELAASLEAAYSSWAETA